eukprot:TRINITY_DN27188_c0_g1_i1.p1 TRINITY_DN27188_c0_g1~~TRINITY_DN27188_c0_g1_i1.p1  ORF type:complete len:854 (+),score=336.70 TRINITY_DN27188_c0_g1_i1:189-2750(+)
MKSDGEGKKVTVAVRIRPTLEKRGEKYEIVTVKKVEQNVCVCVNPSRMRDQQAFCFDHILDEDDTQDDVYKLVAADISASTLEGVDNVIVTYGQTGSGKTYTLLGNGLHENGELDEDSGIFLRVLDDLLSHKELCRDSHHLVIVLGIVEIYNDGLRDLLNAKNQLNIREQGDDIVVTNPTLKVIATREDMSEAFQIALDNRTVAPTLMNDRSSRSHAMFTVDVLQQRKSAANPNPPDPEAFMRERILQLTAPQKGSGIIPFSQPRPSQKRSSLKGRGLASPTAGSRGVQVKEEAAAPSNSSEFPITQSTLTMVDLAGSERAKKSGAQGAVLQEAVAVNKSLTSLGKVVNSLNSNSKHVPFRESKLTRLLRRSLVSGLSKILLITNLAPTESSFGETSSSLHFADRLQELKAPTSLSLRSCGTDKDAEYLRNLRAQQELCSELSVAATLFPAFAEHLESKKGGGGACGASCSSLRSAMPQSASYTVRRYKALHAKREEEGRLASNSEFKRLVTALVAGMEQERPGLSTDKQRIDELEDRLERQRLDCDVLSKQLASLEEQLHDAECASGTPHKSYLDAVARYEAALQKLDVADKTEAKLQKSIEKIQQEINSFAAPMREAARVRENADEESALLQRFESFAKISLEWGKKALNLIESKQLNTERSAEVDSLREECADVPAPSPTSHDDPAGATSSAAAIDKGVSPLAWHFEGIREGVVFEPPPESADNASLRRQMSGILKGIAAEKVCSDDDGRQLFGVLSQVHVLSDHIMEAAESLADTEWGDSQALQKACEQDSVAFAMRAFVLAPPCTGLLTRARQGDLGVLEFVEVLLRDWQQQTADPSTALSPTYSEHP